MSALCIAGPTLPSIQGKYNLFAPYGGFELGVADLEIYCFPRYAYPLEDGCAKPRLTTIKAPEGRKALELEGRPRGGYLLEFSPKELSVGSSYVLSLAIDAVVASNLRIEVRAASRRLDAENFKIRPGLHKYEMRFTASKANQYRDGYVVHSFRMWVTGREKIVLDTVALYKEGDVQNDAKIVSGLSIIPAGNIGLYHEGKTAKAMVHVVTNQSARLEVVIRDPVNQQEMKKLVREVPAGKGVNTYSVSLYTAQKGYYDMIANLVSVDGRLIQTKQRGYVVLGERPKNAVSNRRFGLAVEEHGYTTKSNALAPPRQLYKWASDIGAGSIRIFSLAMPDLVSRDGKNFDFKELDFSLRLAKEYDLDPLVMLGENRLERIPAWLRLDKPLSNSDFDIASGILVRRVKESFLKSGDKNYFNYKAYEKYLEAVFTAMQGKVDYYSYWNEPGYKFGYPEFERLIATTYHHRNRFDTKAKLVGFSSTTRGDTGLGKDKAALPRYLDRMARDNQVQYLDILSYHSAHAYRFNSLDYDERDQETGFERRIFQVLKRTGSDIPVWDTEIGVAWRTRRKEALDARLGTRMARQESSIMDWLEPARQLPMIYASRFANGVKRVFWFSFESTSMLPISSTARSRSMFGIQMEPTPQIAVYSAMTQMLADRPYRETVENAGGARMYIFGEERDWVSVASNWQGVGSTIEVGANCSDYTVFDVMGRKSVDRAQQQSDGCEIRLNEWPIYVRYRPSSEKGLSNAN